MISTISVDIEEHELVILDFTDTVYMDDSAALVVEQLIDAALTQGTDCIIMGLGGLTASTLRALNVLKRIPRDHFVKQPRRSQGGRAKGARKLVPEGNAHETG